MVNSNCQYGILSTFERSWICKIEKDENGKVKEMMQITGPYATSQAAADKFEDIENQPFLKVAFVVFFLMHSSGEAFKANYEIDDSIPLAGDSDDDQDPDFKSPSKSSFSNQKTSLYMPTFEHVKSLDVWSGKYAFLGNGRCGKVFMGTVNGKKVAVKVNIFIVILFLIIKYVILSL